MTERTRNDTAALHGSRGHVETGYVETTIEYGHQSRRVAGTYVSYFDAERIRDRLRDRGLRPTDVEVVAFGIERKVLSERRPSIPEKAFRVAVLAVVPCAVAVFVATGFAPTKIFWGTLAGFVAAAAIAASSLWSSVDRAPVPPIEPASWGVLIREEPDGRPHREQSRPMTRRELRQPMESDVHNSVALM
jgi:hypothetical protein